MYDIKSEIINFWKSKVDGEKINFPIVYFEIKGAFECIGFRDLGHLLSADFYTFPSMAEDLIIDSNGSLYKLGYENYLFPVSFIKQLSIIELSNYFDPSVLQFHNESKNQKIDSKSKVGLLILALTNEYAYY